MNKPGGTARINKMNADGTFSVSYVLGGGEKAVDIKYIKCPADVGKRERKEVVLPNAPAKRARDVASVARPITKQQRVEVDGVDFNVLEDAAAKSVSSTANKRESKSSPVGRDIEKAKPAKMPRVGTSTHRVSVPKSLGLKKKSSAHRAGGKIKPDAISLINSDDTVVISDAPDEGGSMELSPPRRSPTKEEERRLSLFTGILAGVLHSGGIDTISFVDLVEKVNARRSHGTPHFSADECTAMCSRLQDDDKVMLSQGKVYRV